MKCNAYLPASIIIGVRTSNQIQHLSSHYQLLYQMYSSASTAPLLPVYYEGQSGFLGASELFGGGSRLLRG